MQRKFGFLAAVLFLWALAPAAPPAAAQASASMTGLVKDLEGKPYADAGMSLKNTDTGTVYTAKTGKNGRYTIEGLRSGHYEFTVLDPKGAPLVQSKFDLHAGENPLDINLKDLITPEMLAERKKEEEETQKFQSMKASFDAGRAALEKAQQLRAQIPKAPADQRSGMQQQLSGMYQEALQNFQRAQSQAEERDPNQQLFWYNIAVADEGLGKNDDAVSAYQKAIELAQNATGKQAPSKPQIAGYYANMGNLLGKLGKIDDANKAYEAAATADPTNAGAVWLNSGITLYKANRLPEAVVPLQKATALLPSNAQAWFLLGAALVSTMEVKQEGDKEIPVLKPGTVEAYQKCIELDPNGTWGTQAKEGLEQLQAMGAGVETKVKVKKGKS
jgi:tetratricopeptide (TPR) repeat protein